MAHSGCLRCPLVSKTERFSNRQNGEAVSASPGGKPRGGGRKLVPLNRVLAKIRGYGRIISAPTAAAAEPPTGRQVGDPYKLKDF